MQVETLMQQLTPDEWTALVDDMLANVTRYFDSQHGQVDADTAQIADRRAEGIAAVKEGLLAIAANRALRDLLDDARVVATTAYAHFADSNDSERGADACAAILDIITEIDRRRGLIAPA